MSYRSVGKLAKTDYFAFIGAFSVKSISTASSASLPATDQVNFWAFIKKAPLELGAQLLGLLKSRGV